METKELIRTETAEQPEAFSSEKAKRAFIGPKLRGGITATLAAVTIAVPSIEYTSHKESPPQNPSISATVNILGTELVGHRDAAASISRQTELQNLLAHQKKEAELKRQAELKKEANKAPGSLREQAQDIINNDAQFKCFDNIIRHESTWNPRAINPKSGAYGLVQALPGSKMASEGADWKTNPKTQIKWGLKYMNERYGSPCEALAFRQKNNWY